MFSRRPVSSSALPIKTPVQGKYRRRNETDLRRAGIDVTSLECRELFSATPVGDVGETDDPQLLEAGAVDSLFAEDFSNPPGALETRSGTWEMVNGEYQVTPNSDGISTFLLNEPIPANFEVGVSINMDDVTSQHVSNAFVILDYEGSRNFRFAGAYAGSDQWVIGHRNSRGWFTDATVDAIIDPLTDYQLSITVENDNKVTLYVDGSPQLSHVFSQALSDGAIGIGTYDAVSRFDDIFVRSISIDTSGNPTSLPYLEDFNDGEAQNLQPESGTWTLSHDRYSVASEPGGDGLSTLLLENGLTDSLEIDVTINMDDVSAQQRSTAFVVFDYQDATNFRFAGALAGDDEWVIGQRTSAGWEVDVMTSGAIDAFTDYDVRLVIEDATGVSLYVDDALVVAHTFADSVTDGSIGLGTWNSNARFDDLRVVQETVESHLTASMQDGELRVTGDAGGVVRIVATGDGSFDVMDGAQLVTQAGDVHSLRIDLSDAAEIVQLDLQGESFHGDVYVELHGGDDHFQLSNGNLVGQLHVDAGEGDDWIDIADNAIIQRHAWFNLDDGRDSLHLAGTLERGLFVDGGSGDDHIELASGATLKRTELHLGEGNNRLTTNAEMGRLVVTAGAGNDTIDVGADAVVSRSAKFSLGDGDNSLVLAGHVFRHFCYRGGAGADQVELATGAEVSRHARLALGDGENHLTSNARVGLALCVTSGAGQDAVIIGEESSIGRRARLNVGDGENTLSVQGELGRGLFYAGGNDADQVEILDDAKLAGRAHLHLGGGDNNFVQAGELRRLTVIDGTCHDIVASNPRAPMRSDHQAMPRFRAER